MIPLRFVISRIYAGWFDVHLCRDGAVLYGLSASDVWGNDAPRAWLTMLTALLRGEAPSGWTLFDEEPGTYILALEQGKTNVLTFAYTRWEAVGQEGNCQIWGLEPFSQLAGRISQKAEVCFREEIDFPLFVRSVYEAFLPWAQKQTQYAGSWMPFPTQEWSAFQGQVRELGWDLDSTEQKVEPCTPAT